MNDAVHKLDELPPWPTASTSRDYRERVEAGREYDEQLLAALRARLEAAVAELEYLHRELPGYPVKAGRLWETIEACREPKL